MIGRALFHAFIGLIYLFITLPILVVLVASVSTTPYLVFPPRGFTLRWFADLNQLGDFIVAFEYSFEVAILATALSMLLGTWIALILGRTSFAGRGALMSFFLSPIILPELAVAVGLLQYFSQSGLIHGLLAVVLAHSIICTPYAVRTITAATLRADRSVEDCAASLGAPPWRVLRDITLPLLRPGLLAAAIMAFVISFDNVTISLFLSAPGRITLPALLFNQAAETGLNTTIAAVSALLVIFMMGLMLIVERAIGLETFFQSAVAPRRRAA